MSDSHLRPRRRIRAILVGGIACVVLGVVAVPFLAPKWVKHHVGWWKLGKSKSRISQVEGGVDFARDVRPILDKNCVKCHGPEKQKGGIRLDSSVVESKPGESGELAIVPGDTAKSALVRRVVSHDPDEEMPPKGARLPADSIALLERWISSGAAWPGAVAVSVPAPRMVDARKTKHWAFLPLAKVDIPSIESADWTRTPIDRFVLAAQKAKGLHPNPEAPQRTLIRRLYFDLLGLPPTPEAIDAFENDPSPSAYEHLVDQLLADPHYGERWGRHWLDAARYADSNGYEEDRPRIYAYTYRDFVIRAMNDDLPYDRFVQWQIAGDLLEPHNAQAVAATGFIAAAPNVRPEFTNYREKDRWDELDNIVSTTGSAILGLTVGCARCHDHKFDPISSADYYNLTAFFTSTERVERPVDERQGEEYDRAMASFNGKRLTKINNERKDWQETKRAEARRPIIESLAISAGEKALLEAPADSKNQVQANLLARFADKLAISDDEVRKTLNAQDLAKWEAYDKEVAKMLAAHPQAIPRMLTIRDGPPKKSYVLVRGNPDQKGPEALPDFLSAFSFASPAPAQKTRADLARWLTDVDHGPGALAARVIVNRIWGHHFGRGIVDTPGDFGFRGDSPSDPQLLDWLASELIRGGWRMKPLHKMIVMSAVYRQDDSSDPARVAIDPGNRLWWRHEPQRIEAEILRDSMLAISGCLNPEFFGPACKPRMAPEAIAVTNPQKKYDVWPANVVDGPATWRRSIYIFAKRSNPFPLLQLFDTPDSIGSCTRRNQTTVAPQALTLLNDPFVREQARAFAQRLSSLGSLDARVCAAFALSLGRNPTPEEKSGALRFIERQETDAQASGKETAEAHAMTDFCQGLMALNEFCYVD
ncbi:MAG TPA: PSD1 and planctomycete cytochrome C domain-containing protein [Chthoniobacter sp.]|jgi:hypothetical protein